MKTIIYFILGIILGIITINFCVDAVIALFSFAIKNLLIYTLFAIGFGILTKKCFANM